MIKTLIIDDEKNSVELISNFLAMGGEKFYLAATADSVESGYTAILGHSPDLVFLDIQMQDGTGFDLLRKFDSVSFKVIFITAFQEYAIDAFKFSALDYLLKPLSPLHFEAALKRAEESIEGPDLALQLKALLHNMSPAGHKRKKIVLKTLERIYVVNTDEITRFESEGSYTKVFLLDGKKIMVSKLIKEFDELFSGQGFIRVHQSHLVNIDFVYCFEKVNNQVIMKDETRIPVAARKKDSVIKIIQSV